ncbi:MAG: PD-(D/E)XK nuclease family protein [Crocinitomicaceae bacterium]
MMAEKQLLENAKSIFGKYEKVKEITGEEFNIYRILNMESDEVKTHSNMVATMLDPNGSHTLGSLPMKLFIEGLIKKSDSVSPTITNTVKDIDVESCKVYVEYFISQKTENSGGRIDILIEDKFSNRLVIENKIYAEDQENQLFRYHNFDKRATICYLTLYGNEPSSQSINNDGDLKKKLLNISYETDILEWIKKCRNAAADKPIVRESLNQYIFLIKKLTDQSTNEIMNKELTDEILKDKSSVQAFYNLQMIENELHSKLIERFKNQITQLAGELELGFTSRVTRYAGKDSDFHTLQVHFQNDKMLGDQNLQITFEVQGTGFMEVTYGFARKEKSKAANSDNSDLIKRFEEKHPSELIKKSPNWPVYTYWQEYRIPKVDFALKIYDGSFANGIKRKLEAEILPILK